MKSYKTFISEKLNISSSIKNRILNSDKFKIGLEFEFYLKDEYITELKRPYKDRILKYLEDHIYTNETSNEYVLNKKLGEVLRIIGYTDLIPIFKEIYIGHIKGIFKSYRDGIIKSGVYKDIDNYFTGDIEHDWISILTPSDVISLDIFNNLDYKFISSSDAKGDHMNWILSYDATDDNMLEIVSPILSLKDAIQGIKDINSFIDKYGYTNSKCGFHIHVSHPDIMNENGSIQLDLLKMIALIDEDYIYSIFKERSNTEFAFSFSALSKIFGEWVLNQNFRSLKSHFEMLFMPISFKRFIELYKINMPFDHSFAMDFDKLRRILPAVEFRYLGGTDYQKKSKDIIDMLYQFCYVFEVSMNDNIKFNDIASKNLYDMYLDMIDNDPNFIRKFLTKLYLRFK